MRKIVLFAMIGLGLQSCTFHASEKYACRHFAGWNELPSPPENAEELYALPNAVGPPDKRRYHQHWYQDGDTLGSCWHLKSDSTGCGTETIEFVNTGGVWKMKEPAQLIICAS